MPRVVADARLTSIERIDRASSVLVDSHSLRVFDLSAFEELGQASVITAGDLVTYPGGPWLSHIIQTLVLHETLLVDSILLELEPQVRRAQELFPDAIRGLFIRRSMRERVGDRVDESARVFDPPPGLPTQLWNRWMLLDSSEKPLFDKIRDCPPRLVPPEYSADQEVIGELEHDPPIWFGIPLCARNSNMTVSRAHFYLELARELDVPLCIDPVRSEYLQLVVQRSGGEFASPTAEKVVTEFAAGFVSPTENSLVSFDLRIPAVPEYVLRFAKARRVSLRDATAEVRWSPHAREFRRWCADLVTLGQEGGLRARSEYGKIAREFKAVCEMWVRKTTEEVDYRTRRLRLADIPMVGKLLAAVGMDTITVPDPVIVPGRKYRCFLFLNDLLRDPSSEIF